MTDKNAESNLEANLMESVVFHTAKQSPAVLKHAVLETYLPPFIGKTGSTSSGGAIAFVDGYAGPGRYLDGQEGSGSLVLRKGNESRSIGSGRTLHCFFVEQDGPTVQRLAETVASESEGLPVEVFAEAAASALPKILDRTRDFPTLFYLDPCGLLIPFEQMSPLFERPGGLGAPATEVLLNFSATTLRRVAGHLSSPNRVERTLTRMDEVCGGAWWRQVWLDALPDKAAAEAAVVAGYASRMSAAAGGAGVWTIDVRRKPGHMPLYYLIFASRHPDGLVLFGESTSLALGKWREYLARLDAQDSLFAFGDAWVEDFKRAEAELEKAWVQDITLNLEALLSEGRSFKVLMRYNEVFGEHVGVARGKHLRAAWKDLLKRGVVRNSPVGVKDIFRHPIEPAEPAPTTLKFADV